MKSNNNKELYKEAQNKFTKMLTAGSLRGSNETGGECDMTTNTNKKDKVIKAGVEQKS